VTWIIAFYWLVTGTWTFFSLMGTKAAAGPGFTVVTFGLSMLIGGVFAPAVALKRVLG
jgi:hypothetical protein